MNVFDLMASLRLDKTQYEQGLTSAESEAKNAGGKISDAFNKLGGKMTKVGAGLTAVSAGFAVIGKAAISAFDAVDVGADEVIKKTGATGEAADALVRSYKNVAKNVVGGFDQIGAAIGEINTRMGLTGSALEKTSEEFMKFAKINDTDVTNSVASVDKAMETFNVDSKQTQNVLGLLTKTSQNTGINIDTLTGLLQSSGPVLKEMGFGLVESVNLMGQFEAAGIESATMLQGLKLAATNYSKQGIDMQTGLNSLIERLQDTNTEAEATAEAYEMFGSRGGLAFVNLAKEGKINLKNLSGDLSQYAKVVGDTYEATLDTSDEWALVMQRLRVSVAEVGEKLQKALLPVIKKLEPVIKRFGNWLESLNEEQVEAIVKVAGITAALGGALVVGGKIIKMIGAAKVALTALSAHPIMLMVTAFGALYAATTKYYLSNKEAIRTNHDLTDSQRELVDRVKEEADAWRDAKAAMEERAKNVDQESIVNEKLWTELQNITDENGKIKESYEERAQVIAEELSQALGTEITIVDGQIQKYDELKDGIEKVIAAKKLNSLIDIGQERFNEAYANSDRVLSDYLQAMSEIPEKQAEVNRLQSEYDSLVEQAKSAGDEESANYYLRQADDVLTALNKEKEGLAALEETAATSGAKYAEYSQIIVGYNEALAASASGDVDRMNEAYGGFVKTIYTTAEEWEKQGSRISGKVIVDNLKSDLLSGQKDTTTAMSEIMKAAQAGIIPKEDFVKFVSESVAGIPEGILTGEETASEAFDKVMAAVESEKITKSQAKTWAEDMMLGFQSGIQGLDDKVIKTVEDFAEQIRKRIHFSVPDVGPLSDADKWMPDFMTLMAEGIKKNAGKVIGQVNALTGRMSNEMEFSGNYEIATSPETSGRTYSMGEVTINVYAAEGQDPEEIARRTSEILAEQFRRSEVATA